AERESGTGLRGESRRGALAAGPVAATEAEAAPGGDRAAGHRDRQGAACRAAGLGSDGFDSLALLRAESLVRGKGTGILDEVEAYHDRIRETVVRRLSDADRASWNRQLAEVLEESEAADPETVAIHLEEAGQPVKAARYFQKAAEKAVDALAFDRAAKLYRRVVELPRPTTTRVAR